MSTTSNIHGCALIARRFGVLLRGPSGSGKSRLSQMIIDTHLDQNRFAIWVADDRVELKARGNFVLAKSPAELAGLAEKRYVGICETRFEHQAVIDLVVDLLPLDALERMPPKRDYQLIENTKPIVHLQVPADNLALATEMIAATLDNFN